MTPFATRTAAAELARLLDDAALGSSWTRSASGTSAAPAQLVGLARRLEATAPALAASAAPRAEFRAALRTRLLAVAAVQSAAPASAPVRAAALEAAVSWSRAARARRGVGVAVGAMASVVVVAGVATAGSQSLPGQPFYGVKTAGESFSLRTADGPGEKGTVHLRHATRRLDEVTQLTRGRDAVALSAPGSSRVVAGGTDADLVVDTLADMDADTRAGRRLLVEASDGGTDPRPLAQLTTFAAHQDDRLSDLVDELPVEAQARAQQSLDLVDDVADDALALLLDQIPPAPSAPVPPVAAGTPVPDVAGVPSLPVAPTAPALPAPSADVAEPGAALPAPVPAPSPSVSSDPAPAPAPSGPSPSPAPSPSPSSPAPSPAPSLEVPLPALPSLPVPLPVPVPLPTSVVVPLPVPLPSLPVPVPTTLPTLPAVPGLPGLHLDAAPAPSPAPRATPSHP